MSKKHMRWLSTLSSGMLLVKWQWALSWTFEPNLTQLRAHVMCSGGLVWKPQGEQGSKPAFKSQSLRSRVSSCVMYCGGLVSSPQGELGSKPLYNYDFIYVFPDFLFVCLQSCLKARSSIKTHRTRKLPKETPWRGREEGEGEGVKSAPPISVSSDVIRFLHLHHFNIALRVCMLFV